MKTLSELIGDGLSLSDAFDQIDSLIGAHPSLRELGNNLGADEKWNRMMEHAPSCVYCLVYKEKDIVGYWSCFPVTEEIYNSGLNGVNINAAIDVQDIDNLMIPGTYFAYFVDLYIYRQHRSLVTNAMVYRSFVTFLKRAARSGYYFSNIFAHTASFESIALCSKLGFDRHGNHLEHKMRDRIGAVVPTFIYNLNLSASANTKIFEMDEELLTLYSYYFVNLIPKSDRRSLNDGVEYVELHLRKLISTKLDDDIERLPQNIRIKIGERVQGERKSHPGADFSRYGKLESALEFADLTELLGVMENNGTAIHFSSVFPNKDQLKIKFGQLGKLRNGLRHSRPINEITRKEGEAAILWFNVALKNVTAAALDNCQ